MDLLKYSQCISLIKRHEGFRPELYKDSVGKWTIGYGHNCEAHLDLFKFKNRTITEAEADELFIPDFAESYWNCLAIIPNFLLLSLPHQSVLLDMTFNLGVGGVLKFKKMLLAVQEGDHKSIAREMINSLWCSQVGKRATELVFMILTNEFI